MAVRTKNRPFRRIHSFFIKKCRNPLHKQILIVYNQLESGNADAKAHTCIDCNIKQWILE